MAYAVAKEKNIDIIIVSEPNKALVQNVQWITDTRLDVAVYFRNASIEVSGITKKAGYICIKLRDHNLYCGYSSPNIPLSAFKQYCDQIMEDVQSSSRKAILLGDLNVKSPEWGSPITDDRGAYLMEWISALDLVVHNTGDEPTFVRGESTSFIDITCSTASAACDITEWRVLQEETMSDHQFIYFEVRDRAERKRYNEKRLVSIDVGKLRSKIKQLVDDIDGVELTVQKVTSLLKEAYSYSTPTKNSRPLNNTPYWWNDQIKAQREECSLARRKLVREGRRCHSEEDRMQLRERYKSCKRELARLIGQSKKKIWQEVCLELEADIWGAGYKIVTGYMNATPKLGLTEDTKVEIVDALFPVREECWIKQPAINDVEMFTEAEIFQAGESIKCRKAPGPDGIPPEQTIREWQVIWEQNTETAQWTKRLIPDLDPWVSCPHRSTDYYLTQALTGHGPFRHYRKRFGRIQDEMCGHCGEVDTAEHTLFDCSRWENLRQEVSQELGERLTTENMVPKMICSERYWKKVHMFIKSVLKIRETEERRNN
nr:unnamed protein product [Callosobruchus chinensis]